MATTTAPVSDRYKWTALSNTTLGVFMAMLDSSIVIISLPAIFRGIHLNPLLPATEIFHSHDSSKSRYVLSEMRSKPASG